MTRAREKMRICGARTRTGGSCRVNALPQSTRCRLHGGNAGRPRGTPEHPSSKAARIEGRRRWLDRMREAKAAGQIEKIPGGRRAKGLPPLSKDRKIREAQRMIEKMMSERAVARRWGEGLTKAERLSEATDEALEVARGSIRENRGC